MFSQFLFNLIARLIFSRWARDYQEHHGRCEDAYTARIGPVRLEINECFVLDHRDAYAGLRLPLPRGFLNIGYRVCLGGEPIRSSGFYYYRFPVRLERHVYRPNDDHADEFPF
jgi:hypothetical protein